MSAALVLRALALVAAMLAAPAAADDYRLQSGDTLEVSVVGLPDFATTVAVDVDGNVSLPLVGPLPAAGRTIEEVRGSLQGILPSKALTRRIYDGTEVQTAIAPEEIIVRVTQYRPIYVGGDVERPGAQAFQPGKTARQALVDAGGFNILRSRAIDPILTHADLQAERAELHMRLERLRLTQARIEAERQGQAGVAGDGEAPGTLEALSHLELEARLEGREHERTSLAESQRHLQDRIQFLRQQLASEQGVAKADASNEARVRSLVERGISSEMALVEAERETLASVSRAREVSADIAETERDLEEIVRTANQVEDDRRVQLVQEAQQIAEQIAVVTARLEAVAEKLLYVGGVGAQSLSMASQDFTVRVYRDDGGRAETVEVGLDSPLRPGDVVEIQIGQEALHRLLGTSEAPAPAPRAPRAPAGRMRRGARRRHR